MQDKIHQYRKSLIKGYESVRSAALNVGAYGMVISRFIRTNKLIQFNSSNSNN